MIEQIALSIPSPSDAVWELGPIPIRGYAVCIIAGVFAAVVLGERRWVARGGRKGQVGDLALWGVPFGIVGARIYHVITDNDKYFGPGQDAVRALYIWEGGLGIWGGIAFGVLGGWLYARTQGIRLSTMMDALAPCLLVAQALGRVGNYLNQELFGKPLQAWWALEIDPENRPEGYTDSETFHPTFLYEAGWNLGAAVLLVWLDRKLSLGFGRVMALYVAFYCAGRGWIEMLRIDPVSADDVGGLRLNVWTSLVLGVLALAYFAYATVRKPGRSSAYLADSGQPNLG